MAKVTGEYNYEVFEGSVNFSIWEKDGEFDEWVFDGSTLAYEEKNVTSLPNPGRWEYAGSNLKVDFVDGDVDGVPVSGIPVISGGTITDIRRFTNEKLDGTGSWISNFNLANAQIDAVAFYNAFDNEGPANNATLWINMLSGNDIFILSDNPDGNYVRSYAGNDHITGSAGNDIIDGGAGDDTIIGGGGIDIAVFSGKFTDYKITKLTGNSFTVQDTRGIDGTDLVQDISTFRFSDVDKSFTDLSTAINTPTPTPDILTGIRILDSFTGATQVAGNDGIIDRFVLQANTAPSIPFRITVFSPDEDFLVIPQELAGGIAQRTFFGVQKVVAPDRPLSKREQKSFKKEQKAVSKLVKRIGRTGDGFAYNQMTGQLFIDTNGKKKGFGEGGGLLAVLEDTPAIGIDNFQFL